MNIFIKENIFSSRIIEIVFLYGFVLSLLLTIVTYFVLKKIPVNSSENNDTDSFNLAEQFRYISDNVPVNIAKIDSKLNYVFVNNRYCELFQKSYKDFIGKSVLSVIGSDAFERSLPFYNIVLKGEKVQFENYVTNSQGESVYFQMHYIPEIIKYEVTGFYIMAYDITNLKLIESELRNAKELAEKQEEQISLIMNATTEGIFGIDTNGICTYINKSCLNILGYSNDKDLIGKNIHEMIHQPKDCNVKHDPEECRIISSMLNKASVKEMHDVFWKADGKRIYVKCKIIPQLKDNTLMGAVISFSDITDNLKHNETEQKLLDAVYNSQAIVIILDAKERVEYANKFFYTLTGFAENSFTGKQLESIFPSITQMSSQIVFEDKNCSRIPLLCSNGEIRIILWNSTNLYNEKDNKIASIVHGQDITDMLNSERKVVKAIIEAEENERYNFSKELHDSLGPLLSAIKMNYEWLNKPDLKTPKEEILMKFNNVINEAILTVKEISHKLSPHTLDNYGLIYALRSFIEKVNYANNIEITLETDIENRFKKEIETTLYRVLLECINNTLKHAKAEKILIKIYTIKNTIHVRYSDDGIGFDYPSVIERNRGLGLNNLISRIQTLDGNIEIKSKKNEGVIILISIENNFKQFNFQI